RLTRRGLPRVRGGPGLREAHARGCWNSACVTTEQNSCAPGTPQRAGFCVSTGMRLWDDRIVGGSRMIATAGKLHGFGLTFCALSSAAAQSFVVVHPPPGESEIALYGASADGSVIAGEVNVNVRVPRDYRWTAATGWQSVPIPCTIEDVSQDGSTLVGEE